MKGERMRKAGAVLAALLLGALAVPAARAASVTSATRQAEVNSDLSAQLDAAAATDRLVVFVHADDVATSRAAATKAGLSVVTTWDSIGVTVAQGTPAAIRSVAIVPGVTYLEPDRELSYELDTAHVPTRVNEARTPEGLVLDPGGNPYDGTGVSIAVIDSGIDREHAMFMQDGVSKVRRNTRQLCPPGVVGAPLCTLWTGNLANTDIAGGHGTHVAGIAAGYQRTTANGRLVRGVAPDATLIGVAAGAVLNITHANEALQWVVTNHANPCAAIAQVCPPIKVVNNSWGPGGSPEGGSPPAYDPQSATTKLVQKLVLFGVSVVFAAGNDGGDGSQRRTSPYGQDPTPGVIGVGNYDDNDTGTRNGAMDSSSSRGDIDDTTTYPDLSAPGANILSACAPHLPVCRANGDVSDANYASISGTSMAAPYVAGAIAVMLEADPTLTPLEIEDILEDTAHQFGDPASYKPDTGRNADHTTSFDKGHGLLDMTAALGEVLGVTPPAPPAGDSPATSETKPYVGVEGDAVIHCALGVGGACFGIASPKPGATITIEDDVAEWPVAAQWSFRDADDTELSGGFMCGTTSQPVPAGATRLLVFVAEATGPAACLLADGSVSPGAATTGTVTVDWVPVPISDTETLNYVAPPGDVGGACLGVGDVCFDVKAGATTAAAVITDDFVDGDVGAFYSFRDAAGDEIEGDLMCGSATLSIPSGATLLRFFMQTATGPLVCEEPPGSAVAGSVAVTWS